MAEAGPMYEVELLAEVLAKDALDADARAAFQDWHDRLLDGRWFGALTPKQAAWLKDVARRLGIDVEPDTAENLVSSGKVRVTERERTGVQQFLQSLGPLPKKPGRR